MISSELKNHARLNTEEEFIENETTLNHLLGKLRHHYHSTIVTGECDRMGFESVLKEIDVHFSLLETQCNQTIEILRAENMIVTKDREIRIKEWKERYDKIQYKWNELTEQLTHLQNEKEELRIQRDQLLIEKEQKEKLHDNKNSSILKNRRQLFEKILSDVLVEVAESLQADRATIFIYSSRSDDLRSIAIYSASKGDLDVRKVNSATEDNFYINFPKEIRIPVSKGIAGAVFSTGISENITNAINDKRFFPDIDNQTGYSTKVMLAYPIYSVQSNRTIGVLEVINKKSKEGFFTSQDEAKCTEFSSFLRHIFSSAHELYDFLPTSNNLKLTEDTSDSLTKKSIEKSPRTISFAPLMDDHICLNSSNFTIKTGSDRKVFSNDLMISKDLEEYSKKVEQCWRKSVEESAIFQNKLRQIEEENKKAKIKIFLLETKVTKLEEANKEIRAVMVNESKKNKKAKQEWQSKETEIKNERKLCVNENQQPLLDRMNGEEAVKNIMDPIGLIGSPAGKSRGSAILTLPYIESKKISKKNIYNPISPGELDRRDANSISLEGPNSPCAQSINNIATRSFDTKEPSQKTIIQVSVSPKDGSLCNNVHNSDSPQDSGQMPSFKDIYLEIFSKAPIAIMLLSRNYRIWRVNNKFCNFLEMDEQSLLGLSLSDIFIGVELEILPSLMQYDIVQGLTICRPSEKYNNNIRKDPPQMNQVDDPSTTDKKERKRSKKILLKVNIRVAQLGRKHQHSKVFTPKQLKVPSHILVFTKTK